MTHLPDGERLTADDHLFVVMEQVMGVPVIPQVIWRVDVSGPVLDHVAEVGRRLTAGRLSRLVRRTRGPVRDRWVYTACAGHVRIDRDPVAPEAVTGWLHDRLETDIDSVQGPAWELSAVPTTDGHVIVSLVRSHVVADGAAMIRAVTEAVTGQARTPRRRMRRGDSVRDALSLLTAVGRAAVSMRKPPARGAIVPENDTEAPAGPAVVPTVAVRVDAARFDAVASSRGGTANTLFQAVTLGVLVGSGRVNEGDTVPLAVPMSVRDRDGAGDEGDLDLRANATTGATVTVRLDPGRYDDLGEIRAAAKAAYRDVTTRTGPDAVAAMAQIAQVLPDAVVRRAADGSTTPLCLASNLGEPSDAFTGLGLDRRLEHRLDRTACDVALRSVIRAGSARELAARQGGVSAWAVQTGPTLSLSFTSLDPAHVRDAAHLLDLVRQEMARWGLEWGSDVTRWL
ncbi:hypothetical protein [Corynebacterium glyciniphilum]|uniref:hypothetical protein n=1 Tax=Corynebacterium glyciniphilum TaxID=1404244 RepID=UPI0011AB50EA|nr:hypothetical protein [Corynebacterium glyciniphilum]